MPSSSSHAAFVFDRVSKRYGGAAVLDEFTLDVTRGDLFGMVGGNGAGKTTLIKCLLDLCSIDGGAIAISGTPHVQTSARADLAFLPERFSPPHYLTGRDFLRYMAELHRSTYSETLV